MTSQTVDKGRHKALCIKIGMVGDSQTGKTTLRDVYIDGEHDVDFKETMAVNFAEKTERVGGCDIKMSVWDFGGHMPDLEHLEQVCEDAHAVLFVFDLCRPATLVSVYEWHRRVRAINTTATPLLVGTKYDQFLTLRSDAQHRMVQQACSFAKILEAPLVLCSSFLRVHISKVFALIVSHFIDVPPAFGVVLPNPRSKVKTGETYTPLPVLDFRDLAKRHDWPVTVQTTGLEAPAVDTPLEEKPRRPRRPRTMRRSSLGEDDGGAVDNLDAAPAEAEASIQH